ncbi:MAG: class I SAM-dependent methyltransferase [bacterium]|nr:class I SAM-dependent methyltransferase [bacterium]
MHSIAFDREPRMVRGLPRFVADEHYASSFGLQWMRHARAQLDVTTGQPISYDRLFSVTGWPARMEGERVLEAGCGAGRFTAVLAGSGAAVSSFDLSQAVEANAANHGNLPNVRIFQASITDIPFAPGQFDRVLCLGVLQHTPDPAAAFHALAAQVRPGGALAVDVYRRDLLALLQWKYVLRPLTKRLPPAVLYRVIARAVPALLPVARTARRIVGRAGARLVPIAEYGHLGFTADIAREWAILDTFDMLSPQHDHPQTLAAVRQWFADAGFVDVVVEKGLNGIIGRGTRPR